MQSQDTSWKWSATEYECQRPLDSGVFASIATVWAPYFYHPLVLSPHEIESEHVCRKVRAVQLCNLVKF